MRKRRHASAFILSITTGFIVNRRNQTPRRHAFNDAGFKRVTIPHTNKLLPWHGFDDKEYEFVSIYRRHFKLPVETKDARVFVDFGGVMTAATVWINGQRLGEYRGGYTPFSFELTPHLNWKGDNVLAVEVDSTERKDIPPFGGEIDYLTFGGIYRDVNLRVVPKVFIENVFARPADVLGPNRSVDVRVFLDESQATGRSLELTAELRDGSRVIATNSSAFTPNRQTALRRNLEQSRRDRIVEHRPAEALRRPRTVV